MVGGMSGGTVLGDDWCHGRVGLGHHGRGERGGGAVLGRDHGKLQELELFLLWENVGLTLLAGRETAERRSRAI